MPKCWICGHQFEVGEEAYESDWKVINVKSDEARFRMETRYNCIKHGKDPKK